MNKNDTELLEWKNKDFWELSLKKYRVSKMIRKIINKNKNGFEFNELSKLLNVDRHYIYQVMLMNIKPNRDFIDRLESLNNNRYGK